MKFKYMIYYGDLPLLPIAQLLSLIIHLNCRCHGVRRVIDNRNKLCIRRKPTPVYEQTHMLAGINISTVCAQITSYRFCTSHLLPRITRASCLLKAIFCINERIPSVVIRNCCDNSWMNGSIRKVVAERCRALWQNDSQTVKSLQSSIQSEIRHAKSLYAKSIEQSLKYKLAEAWKSLDSNPKLKSSSAACNFDPNEFNVFYNRFDKPFVPPVLPDVCPAPDFFYSR